MKVKLNLVGLDGNAFSVMGAFQKAARRQGFEKVDVDAVISEAMSGDYNHLLATIMEHTTDVEDDYEDEDIPKSYRDSEDEDGES